MFTTSRWPIHHDFHIPTLAYMLLQIPMSKEDTPTFPYSYQPCPWKLSPLHPHISAPDCFLHWLSLFSLNWLTIFPTSSPIIGSKGLCGDGLCSEHKDPANYGVGLLRFTQCCDTFNVPEDLQIQPQNGYLHLHYYTCSWICREQHFWKHGA